MTGCGLPGAGDAGERGRGLGLRMVPGLAGCGDSAQLSGGEGVPGSPSAQLQAVPAPSRAAGPDTCE